MVIFAAEVKAQCTIDTSIHTTGVYPSFIDSAEIGVAYNQVIQYHMTSDTTVVYNGNSYDARIDSMWITSIKGLPAGFHYVCPNPTCNIMGGETGCVKLNGTAVPLQGGIYPLVVYVSIHATLKGGLPVPFTVPDSVTKYYMVVKTPLGVSMVDASSKVVIYPNPATDQLQVYLPNASENFMYQIYNLSGELVQKGNTSGFDPIKEITLGHFNKGVYLLQLNDNGRQYLKKFVIGE